MKRVKLLLAALLMIVCGVNAQEELSSDSFGVYQNGIVESVSAQEKLSSDSTQLFFDDNGELTRIKVLPESYRYERTAKSSSILSLRGCYRIDGKKPLLYYNVECT